MTPLKTFKKQLAGWMTEPDGENDYCPNCFPKKLAKMKELLLRTAFAKESFATRTLSLERVRRCAEGFITFCAMCQKEVFVPDRECQTS